MKKYVSLFIYLLILSGCTNPGGRSWMIPVTIDPSDLDYTPSSMESFEGRRQLLSDSLSSGYVILRSADQGSFNRHEFRPNNYFYYLTGYTARGSYAILGPEPQATFTLSMPPQSIRTLIYEGGELEEEELMEKYGPDRTLSYREIRALIDSIAKTDTVIYMDRSDRTFLADLQRMAGENGAARFRHIGELVDELRVIKEPMEVEFLQKACNITAKALTNVMKECRPDLYEFQIESVIEGTFLEYGSAMPGFNSIVGSGPNSTILHYEPNTRLMEDGDLLLMDIGAEYGYYTADITRTIPVNGKFSPEQRTIYQLVLDAQLAAIEQMKPGNMFMDGHMAAKEVIVKGLTELGLITDPASPWQIKFYILYPSSHYLGMDVHDVGEMGGSFSTFMEQTPQESQESRVLEPGMVLTIEPGLYFREKGLEQLHEIFGDEADSLEIAQFIKDVGPVYEKYMNIGVRIEDDILITTGGNINLSRYAPKEIEDIEQIMR
ncbi:MAG: aminopeptidase P family protein [Bacteroidales bacterium]|nr:aminopeptidase P family protein [Bacteroidales bacterium]